MAIVDGPDALAPTYHMITSICMFLPPGGAIRRARWLLSSAFCSAAQRGQAAALPGS